MRIGQKLYFVIIPQETMVFTTRSEARKVALATHGIFIESANLGNVKRARLQNLLDAVAQGVGV